VLRLVVADASLVGAHLGELTELLRATVGDGAPLGFLHPLSEADARAYWDGVVASMTRGERLTILAVDGEAIVGTVQLEYASNQNARHRAEVQKLAVLPGHRGRGVGRVLMAAIESEAARNGRTLLVLDTREGGFAETFYERLGWSRSGRIPGYMRAEEGRFHAAIAFHKELADAPGSPTRPPLPILDTERLRLRPLVEADVPALFAIFSDPQAMRYWSRTAMTDAAEAAELLAEIRHCAEVGTLYQWGIARREDDLAIGTCTLHRIDPEHRRAEIGYILRRDHWGRGFAHEALVTFVDHAFDAFALHKLEADIDPRNAASIRSVERLGFKREGLLRERYRVGGEIQDSAMYGLLEPEWRAR
jgi:[ribosomal protein S5]-alanine N-acetyltransferase